jgi:putative phosphoesterase
MKIIFFSDIHGNSYVLKNFIKALEKEKPDKVVFCGDIFGYYYHQNEIIDTFIQLGYIVLLGNHDKNFLDILDGKIDRRQLILRYGNSYHNIEQRISAVNIDFMKTLKPHYELQSGNYRIGVFHGSPYDNFNGRVYPDSEIIEVDMYTNYDIVILGHTHHKMVKQIRTTTIINPGSIGQQRDGKGCSYLVLNTADGSYQFKTVEYDVDRLAKDIDLYDNGNEKLKEVLFRGMRQGT